MLKETRLSVRLLIPLEKGRNELFRDPAVEFSQVLLKIDHCAGDGVNFDSIIGTLSYAWFPFCIFQTIEDTS